MVDFLNQDTRANLLFKAYVGIKIEGLPDYINGLKEQINIKKTVVQNMEDAKKDFSGFLAKGGSYLDNVASHMGGDAKDILSNVSDFLKDAKNVEEKTLALLGLMKNAKKEFWLALIQLLVDAAKMTLIKQQASIGFMISVLGAADVPNDLKNAKVSKASLIYAYLRVVSAKRALEEARSRIASGDVVVKRNTDKAIIMLQVAEQRLEGELIDMRKLSDFESSMSAVELMETDLVTHAGDYVVHYISTLLFIQGIYYIEKNVLKSKRVIDAETSDKILKNIITEINTDTKVPMEEMQERWKTKPPSQLELVKNAVKYSKNSRIHWEKIAVYFGENFDNLSDMDEQSQDYSKLLTDLQNVPYLNADRKTAGENVQSIAAKAGVPAANIFANAKGSKTSVFSQIRTKYTKELSAVAVDINTSKIVLSNYGIYRSKLLEFINQGLTALGYQGNPMLDFAMGRMIRVSDVVQGIPSVREVVSGDALKLIGVAVSGEYKDKIISEVLSIASKSNAVNTVMRARKETRVIEEVIDKSIEQRNSEREALEEEVRILEAGAEGKTYIEYYKDKRMTI